MQVSHSILPHPDTPAEPTVEPTTTPEPKADVKPDADFVMLDTPDKPVKLESPPRVERQRAFIQPLPNFFDDPAMLDNAFQPLEPPEQVKHKGHEIKDLATALFGAFLLGAVSAGTISFLMSRKTAAISKCIAES